MLTLLFVLLAPARADTFTLSLADLLTRAPDLALIDIRDEHVVYVSDVVRGKGRKVAPRPDLPIGTAGVLACGYPRRGTCFLGVEKQGVVWFEDVSRSVHNGVAHPGISTLDRLDGLIDGRGAAKLCVRFGDEEVLVDSGTGRGETPAGPVGVTAGGVLAVLQRYGPDQTVYVGNAGSRGQVVGRNGRLGADGCVEFDVVSAP